MKMTAAWVLGLLTGMALEEVWPGGNDQGLIHLSSYMKLTVWIFIAVIWIVISVTWALAQYEQREKEKQDG